MRKLCRMQKIGSQYRPMFRGKSCDLVHRGKCIEDYLKKSNIFHNVKGYQWKEWGQRANHQLWSQPDLFKHFVGAIDTEAFIIIPTSDTTSTPGFLRAHYDFGPHRRSCWPGRIGVLCTLSATPFRQAARQRSS